MYLSSFLGLHLMHAPVRRRVLSHVALQTNHKFTTPQAYSALALVHRKRAEKREKVVGKLTSLDPTEAQRALEL